MRRPSPLHNPDRPAASKATLVVSVSSCRVDDRETSDRPRKARASAANRGSLPEVRQPPSCIPGCQLAKRPEFPQQPERKSLWLDVLVWEGKRHPWVSFLERLAAASCVVSFGLDIKCLNPEGRVQGPWPTRSARIRGDAYFTLNIFTSSIQTVEPARKLNQRFIS